MLFVLYFTIKIKNIENKMTSVEKKMVAHIFTVTAPTPENTECCPSQVRE